MLGVIVKTGRVHKVDIGTAQLASLPELAFQGATRRNKPSLQVYMSTCDNADLDTYLTH